MGLTEQLVLAAFIALGTALWLEAANAMRVHGDTDAGLIYEID